MARWLWLLAVGGCVGNAAPGAPTADAVFDGVCARCHGVNGTGGPALANGVSPRNFHDAAFQAQRTDADLRRVIVEGKNGNMPPFGAAFTPAQLDGLVARVRSYNPQEIRK